MKKILLLITFITSFYSCSNDNNPMGTYSYQQIMVYESSLFDTLTVYTSVNDSLYLGNFDFIGYDSITVKMAFDMINGGGNPFIDFSLVSSGTEIELIRQNLPTSSGFFVLDAKFNTTPSGDCYFRNRSINLGTGYFKIFVNGFRILKH